MALGLPAVPAVTPEDLLYNEDTVLTGPDDPLIDLLQETGYLPTVTPRPLKDPREDSNQFAAGVRAGTDTLQASLYGGLDLLGTLFGSEKLQELGQEGVARNLEEAALSGLRVGSLEEVDGAGSALDYLFGVLGQAVPSLALGFGGAGIGGAIGSRVALRSLESRLLARALAKRGVMATSARETAKKLSAAGIPKEVIDKGMRRALSSPTILKSLAKARAHGAEVGAALSAFPTLSGEVFNELRDAGIPLNAKHALVSLGAGAASAVLEAGPFAMLYKRLFPGVPQEIARNATRDALETLAKAAPKIGIRRAAFDQMLAEGGTEAAQELIQIAARAYYDPSFDLGDPENVMRVVNAGVAGALVGAVTGGLTGAVSKYLGGRAASPVAMGGKEPPSAPTPEESGPPPDDGPPPEQLDLFPGLKDEINSRFGPRDDGDFADSVIPSLDEIRRILRERIHSAVGGELGQLQQAINEAFAATRGLLPPVERARVVSGLTRFGAGVRGRISEQLARLQQQIETEIAQAREQMRTADPARRATILEEVRARLDALVNSFRNEQTRQRQKDFEEAQKVVDLNPQTIDFMDDEEQILAKLFDELSGGPTDESAPSEVSVTEVSPTPEVFTRVKIGPQIYKGEEIYRKGKPVDVKRFRVDDVGENAKPFKTRKQAEKAIPRLRERYPNVPEDAWDIEPAEGGGFHVVIRDVISSEDVMLQRDFNEAFESARMSRRRRDFRRKKGAGNRILRVRRPNGKVTEIDLPTLARGMRRALDRLRSRDVNTDAASLENQVAAVTEAIGKLLDSGYQILDQDGNTLTGEALQEYLDTRVVDERADDLFTLGDLRKRQNRGRRNADPIANLRNRMQTQFGYKSFRQLISDALKEDAPLRLVKAANAIIDRLFPALQGELTELSPRERLQAIDRMLRTKQPGPVSQRIQDAVRESVAGRLPKAGIQKGGLRRAMLAVERALQKNKDQQKDFEENYEPGTAAQEEPAATTSGRAPGAGEAVRSVEADHVKKRKVREKAQAKERKQEAQKSKRLEKGIERERKRAEAITRAKEEAAARDEPLHKRGYVKPPKRRKKTRDELREEAIRRKSIDSRARNENEPLFDRSTPIPEWEEPFLEKRYDQEEAEAKRSTRRRGTASQANPATEEQKAEFYKQKDREVRNGLLGWDKALTERVVQLVRDFRKLLGIGATKFIIVNRAGADALIEHGHPAGAALDNVVYGERAPLGAIIMHGDTAIIFLNDRLLTDNDLQSSLRVFTVLTHELGHAVHRIFYDQLSEPLKQRLRSAWRKSKTDKPFEEWMADQLVAWSVRDRRATNAVQSFFKRVSKALEAAYEAFRQAFGRWFPKLANKSFEEFRIAKHGFNVKESEAYVKILRAYALDGTYEEFIDAIVRSSRTRKRPANARAGSASVDTDVADPGNEFLRHFERFGIVGSRHFTLPTRDNFDIPLAREEASKQLKAAWKRIEERYPRIIRSAKLVANTLRWLRDQTLASSNAVLRRIPGGELIADVFYRAPGETRSKYGTYGNNVQEARGSFRGLYLKLVQGMDKAAKAALVKRLYELENTDATPAEGSKEAEFQQLMGRVLQYLRKAGLPVEEIKNYVPRVWDSEKVRNNRDAIIERITMHIAPKEPQATGNAAKDKAARERWHKEVAEAKEKAQQIYNHMAGEGASAWQDNIDVDDIFEPYSGFMKHRQKILDDEWFNQFRSTDLDHIILNYLDAAVKRAEFNRFFGDRADRAKQEKRPFQPFKRLEEMFTEMRARGATKEDIKLAQRILDANLGRYGRTVPHEVRRVMAWVATYQNVNLLLFATLASFPDIAGPAIRANDTKLAFKALAKNLRAIVSESSDLNELARSFGIISDRMAEHILNEYVDNHWYPPQARKINDTFFRLIGLQKWTQMTRSMALAVGIDYLKSQAEKAKAGDARARHALEELRLTADDVLNWDGTVEGARGRISSALVQFVNESILKPDASHRPLWMSHPGFMLIGHLKSFMYTFHQVITKRLLYNLETSKTPGEILNALLPAGVLLAATALGLELRELIQYKMWGYKARTDRMNAWEYINELFSRSGLLGPTQLALDWEMADRQGNLAIMGLAGPTINHINLLLSKPLTQSVPKSIPVVSRIPKLRAWVRKGMRAVTPDFGDED